MPPLPSGSNTASPALALQPPVNRRGLHERRLRTFYSLLIGNFRPRRRYPRRRNESHVAAIDWHATRWVIGALGVLLLSAADGFLTLGLIEAGAVEANPFMAIVLQGPGPTFAIWKMSLTSIGVVLLAMFAPLRVFRHVPVGALLYAILAAYGGLVGYELWLLEHLARMD